MSEKKLRLCLIGEKILIQSRSSDTGMLWALAQGLSKKGHDVTIISTTSPLKKSEVFRDGIKAYYLYDGPTGKSKVLQFSDQVHKKFLSLHKDKPFDLVHSVDDSGFKIGRNKKSLKVRIAYDIEATGMAELFSIMAENSGTLRSQFRTSLQIGFRFLQSYFMKERALLQTADGIFTTTPQQRTLLERYYLYPDYHTYTVPYGINLGDLTEREESENFKMKLQIPDDAQIILAVSDFTNSLELTPLLKAFEKVVLKNSNSYLIIIGDGPQWKKVEYTMLKLVLGSRVIMPGYVDAHELLNYISLCSVYVNLSSQSTGLEPSMIEAMAQKKIVIGSELSPISEYITEKKNGFLVRPADEETLVALLSNILNPNTNADESFDFAQIGEKARQKVLESFNRQKMIESLTEAYYEIIRKSSKLSSAPVKRVVSIDK
jgi:glycosyltransferase involved in cell wall biosynthesis